MRIRGASRVRAWVERFTAPLRSQAVVLTYHRVFDADFDPQELCVSARNFGAHLDVLLAHYEVVPLVDLAEAAVAHSLGKGKVAITFDDGYVDTLTVARPALEGRNAPATVFVVSGGLAAGAAFWWDRLERVLLRPGKLPENLSVKVGGRTLSFDLGRSAGLDAETFEELRGWGTSNPADPTPRHAAYRALWQFLRTLPHEAREECLHVLESSLTGVAPGKEQARSLSSGELRELARSCVVEIGAHTVHHEVLASLPAARQRQEIVEGRATLGRILGRPVRAFSYPYGARSDYTSETVALVQEAGFACACANTHGLVRHGVDTLQLPRVVVRNWSGRIFAKHLRCWMGC